MLLVDGSHVKAGKNLFDRGRIAPRFGAGSSLGDWVVEPGEQAPSHNGQRGIETATGIRYEHNKTIYACEINESL